MPAEQVSSSNGSSGGISPIAAYSYLGNVTNSSATPTGSTALVLGAPGFTPAANTTALQITSTVASYFQGSIQNLSNNSAASTDFVVTADNGTDSTHYADFGINSSGGGGTPFTNANAAYLYSTDSELNIGALGASGVVKVHTTGGTAAPVLAATFTATQGLTVVGAIATSLAGAPSISAVAMTGAIDTTGTATTNLPMLFFQTGSASAASSYSTSGTFIGVNSDSGFSGNFLDFHANGGTSLFLVNSVGSIVMSGSITTPASINSSRSGTASGSTLNLTGTPFSGSGTTSTPLFYLNGGSAPTTWSASATYIGANAVSGFAGNFLDFHVNGGSSVFNVSSAGAIACGSVAASSLVATNRISSSYVGAASISVITTSTAPLSGGSGTTNFPQWFANFGGSAVTNWSTSGTVFGGNATTSYAGNWIDFHNSTNTSVFMVTGAGALTTGSSIATSTPNGGTSAAWKFGIYHAGAPTATGYVELDVAGTLYQLVAKL